VRARATIRSRRCTARSLHLAAYTDASSFGGAEQALATVLAGIGPDIRVTVVGSSASVVDEVARRRPDARRVVVPAVETKRDVLPILHHFRVLRRLRPDVCHVNLRIPYACQYGLLAALLTQGVRVVAVEHLPLHSDSRLSRWFKRRTSARLAAHIAVGERAAREVEGDAGLPPRSISVIRNGVPAPQAGQPDTRFASGPVIGAIGRLEAQKGFDVLVDALPQLPGVTAVVVGEGRERAALQARAIANGVDSRFILAGWKPDAASLLQGFDCLVLPSRFEGLPLVVLEAFGAGVPVVATDVGSVSEAVTPETGLLIPPDDPVALAAAVRRVLDDEELRLQLIQGGLAAWRDEFNATVMAHAYDALYREVAT
jgi:glycosyltransferase involved in cell wall biosynthesis